MTAYSLTIALAWAGAPASDRPCPALSPQPKTLYGRQEKGGNELERDEKCVATGLSHPMKDHSV